MVLVAGEAGVGKTTFVDAVVRAAGSSVRLAHGGCDGSATPAPEEPTNNDPLTRTAVAAALLVCPVAFQALAPAAADGIAGHLAFALSQLAAWLLVATVARALPVPARRLARIGRFGVLSGVACQVAFALTYATTALDGEPLEASFVFFLLGFLGLAVGGLAWGTALLRTPAGPSAGVGLVAVGGLGLLAMLVGVDPFHDVFLLASYAAWLLVGRGLRSAADRPADALAAR